MTARVATDHEHDMGGATALLLIVITLFIAVVAVVGTVKIGRLQNRVTAPEQERDAR